MTTPKDFFLWLATIVALYVSVGSLVSLLFVIIDQVFSLKIIGYSTYTGAMSFAIASLVVVFPLYIWLTRIINTAQRTDVTKRDIWVRRWGVYLTLFLAGMGMIIDLVTLLYTFLQGAEITTAFMLKVLVILAVFGSAFMYYLKEVQGYWLTQESLSKKISYIVMLLVFITILTGFYVLGSPRTQRLLRYDSQRVNDLISLQYSITDYYRSKQMLPVDLETMKDPLAGVYIPTDPETGALYGYEKVDTDTFKICATFSKEHIAVAKGADMTNYAVRTIAEQSEQWPHGVGLTCFERTVDPEKYPKY